MSPPATQAEPVQTPGGGVSMSAAEISRLGGELYADAGLLTRLMCRYRSNICPLELVIEQTPPGSSVLDIGCGSGLVLLSLAASGRLASGHGFDASPGAIEAAKGAAARLAAKGTPAPSFEHRRVEQGLPDGPFEAVLLIDVMHHVDPEARRELFSHACKRVAPGGRLIYKDMVDHPRWRALANQAHDLVMARQLIRYCAIEEIEAWAGEESLTLVHREDATRLWYGHELRVFERSAGDA
ncbi:MAG: class I SAM-dependent methyltransferase [Phycisphaerales bacterium]